MEKWEPDQKALDRVEKLWSDADSLDDIVVGSNLVSNARSLKEIIDMFRKNKIAPKIVEYLERNFPLDQKIPDRVYTGKELIEDMRKGTPYGIFRYLIIEAHSNCCCSNYFGSED